MVPPRLPCSPLPVPVLRRQYPRLLPVCHPAIHRHEVPHRDAEQLGSGDDQIISRVVVRLRRSWDDSVVVIDVRWFFPPSVSNMNSERTGI